MREKLAVLLTVRGTLPADISAVVGLLLVTDLLATRAVDTVPALRAALGLGVLLFAPGYVLMAVLFPGRGSTDDWTGSSDGRTHLLRPRPISSVERIALSFGTSVVLVPLVGFVVASFTGSMSTGSVLLGLNAFVIGAAGLATVRRNSLPEEKRFHVSFRRLGRTVDAVFGTGGRRVDAVLTVLLLASVLAAASTMGFALVAPQDGETYTSVALLTEDADGALVAADYPSTLASGEGAPMVLRVDNHEGVDTTYTVVVELQRVDSSGDTVSVTEEASILTERETVQAGGAWLLRHTVAPTMSGTGLRVAYHVYRGQAPDDPNEENAYRSLYLWIDVVD